MVNATGSLVLRPDPLRHAFYCAYLKMPRVITVPLEIWSNDITYGRLIDAAEKDGEREELRNLLGDQIQPSEG